ncbi:MAG: 5'-3' exoribonuclease [Sulfobacillus sp.]
MGISHYFHWLVTRYESGILRLEPDEPTDFLFLDLNCAIHPAARGAGSSDFGVICDSVVAYIDKIISTVIPRQSVCLAIDGVAPAAKMEQQRLRRFKAFKERRMMDELRRRHRIPPPEESPDFNMISPCTEFMVFLENRLRREIVSRWSGYRVSFSDSSEPGEGEHKIFERIRALPPGGNATIYGLDSDLIMLCLANYRPGTRLFREVLHFGKGFSTTKSALPEETCYLSVDQLRRHLAAELLSLPDGTDRPFCSESILAADEVPQEIIDDYVTACFLLGNDFLPHLPSMKISEGGLDRLLRILRENNSANEPARLLERTREPTINVAFMQDLLRRVAASEEKDLQKQEIGRIKRTQHFRLSREFLEAQTPFDRAVVELERVELRSRDPVEVHRPGWRGRYRRHFFADRDIDSDAACENYLRGLAWTARYYYSGVASCGWRWKYGELAAPLAEDLLCALDRLGPAFFRLDWEKGSPVRPLVQLMYILPPQSGGILPPAVARYQTSADSPIRYGYPSDFNLEDYHKKKLWECYPILPKVELHDLERVVDLLESQGADRQIGIRANKASSPDEKP